MELLYIKIFLTKKIKIWADAVKFAYRNNLDNIFNPDYDPNATSSSIDPA